MAYDRVVDSAALDGKLTAIADAIRSKTGGTASLTLDDMTTAINGITTGGPGNGDPAFRSGSFTPAENTTSMTLDVGAADWNYLMVWTDDTVTGTGVKALALALVNKSVTLCKTITTFNTGSGLTAFDRLNDEPTVDGSVVVFKNATSGSAMGYFLGGKAYHWIAW